MALTNMKNIHYLLNILFGVSIFASILLFIDIKASVVGFSTIFFGVVGIVIVVFALISKKTYEESTNTFSFIKKIFSTSLASILMIAVTALLLVVNIKYYDPISNHEVPDTFYQFENVSIILLIVKLYFYKLLINSYVDGVQTLESKKNKLYSNLVIYVFSLLNLVSVAIMYIILKYFMTDGYQNLE